MKVTTEACLFGALAIVGHPINILDAGSGTGLLTLMLAQRFPEAKITAVDLDETAISLSQLNFQHSSFADRLDLISADYSKLPKSMQFDAIVCNPPFYKTGFLSTQQQRNRAMRDHANLTNLLALFSTNLSQDGQAWVLLPSYEQQEFEQMAKTKDLYCTHKIRIENRPGKLFRIVSMFSKKNTIQKEDLLCICHEDQTYTPAFTSLLKDFYLAF